MIRFWINLTKKVCVEVAQYEEEKKIYFYLQFLAFFSWIRIQIFRIRIQIFCLSLSGLRKKVRSEYGQKDPDPKG